MSKIFIYKIIIRWSNIDRNSLGYNISLETYIKEYSDIRIPLVYIGLGNNTNAETLYESINYIDLR